MRAPLGTVRGAWLALVCAAVGGVAQGQAAAPLLKADLVRLMSNAFISAAEVAAVVRRNCLAFRPTERDWADIRSLGATPDVVASITACGNEPAAARPPTNAPVTTAPSASVDADLQVIVRRPLVVAHAGGRARIPVIAARGGIPRGAVPLALQGSGSIGQPGGPDLVVSTDDTGFASFELPVGRRLASYRLEIVSATGARLPGRPTVQVVVRPGAPALVRVEPREVLFERGLDTVINVTATIRDSVGHAVVGEPVALLAAPPETEFRPGRAMTDSLGRATFLVRHTDLQRSRTLQVRVRDVTMAWVEVLVGAPLAESATRFRSPPTLWGTVRSSLDEPLVFEAWTRLGLPASGRQVTFRAVNAAISPATAITDTAGRAFVGVTLGERVGPAIVVATIDSLEKHVTLEVTPGLPVDLVLRQEGGSADGGPIAVALGDTLRIRLTGRDAYGNWASVANLAPGLREQRGEVSRKLRLLRLETAAEEGSSVLLTFTAVRTGSADLSIGHGITASVRVEVVRDRRSLPAGVSTAP